MDSEKRPLMISRGWIQAAAIVLVFGFFIMGVLTYYTYHDEPPIPEVVKAANGSTLFTRADIMAGQQVFLSNGLMEYGSVFGHGGYLATFRRKNDVSSGARVGPDRSGALPECALVLPGLFPSPEGSFFPAGGVRLYPFLRLAKTLPILMSVSATTPNPTHRSIPSSPRYRLPLRP